MMKIIRVVTLKACATVAAATNGAAFGCLVVIFLGRAPRCIRATRVVAL